MLTPLRYSGGLTVCSRPAVKAGIRYERQTEQFLKEEFGADVEFQYPCSAGRIDAVVHGSPRILIEVKITQTPDAYYQLERYASCFVAPVVRCVITKTVVRTIVTPEPPIYLQKLGDLRGVEPGYYIIPFARKF